MTRRAQSSAEVAQPRFKANVKSSSEPIEWNIITSGPAVLKRFGWTQNSLKAGDRVSVLCNPMTDGSRGGRLHTVVLLDTGQVLRTKLSDGPQGKIE